MKKLFHRYLFISLLIFVGCSNDKKGPEDFKVGAIIPQTGVLAFMGELEKKGIDIAIESIKSKRIKIFYEDSRGSAKDGLNAAQKLLNKEKVQCLITTGTSVSRSISSLHNQYKFIQSAFCMDPTIQDNNDKILRLYYGMEQEAQKILDYFELLKKSNAKDLDNGVNILSVNHQGTLQQTNDYLIPGLKKLGIKIKYIDNYELNQKDFKNIITKIKADRVKYLILIDYGFVFPEFFKALEEAKLLNVLKIVGGWGFIAQKNLKDYQLQNVVVATPTCMVNKNDLYVKFEHRYFKKFNSEPNFESALAYQNIVLIDSAIGNSSLEIKLEKIIRKLLNTSHNSLLGEISIDGNGKLQIPMTLAKYKGGKLIELTW